MERTVPRLLLILALFAPPAPLCAAASGLNISKVVHVSSLKSWQESQQYCRAHHSDLVTIRNAQEANELALFEGWIGLYRRVDPTWKWSKGDEIASFIFWDFGHPHVYKWCAFKHGSNERWANDNCGNDHPFLCIDERLILVQEMKTWEEAVLHCRKLQAVDATGGVTTHLYDIASLPEANNVLLDRETMAGAATNEVWVGLRFLAGQWLWVSGEQVTSSYLPHCPAQEQRCGALEHNNIQWKIMDCSEKRHFICSIKL